MFITRRVLKGDVSVYKGYRIGGGEGGGYFAIYRTPPFDEGKLLFPLWKYGVNVVLHPCRSSH